MIEMLTPTCKFSLLLLHTTFCFYTCVMCYHVVSSDGVLKAVRENDIVPQHLLLEILVWRVEGASDEDVIVRLRLRTIPKGYTIHTLQPGMTLC